MSKRAAKKRRTANEGLSIAAAAAAASSSPNNLNRNNCSQSPPPSCLFPDSTAPALPVSSSKKTSPLSSWFLTGGAPTFGPRPPQNSVCQRRSTCSGTVLIPTSSAGSIKVGLRTPEISGARSHGHPLVETLLASLQEERSASEAFEESLLQRLEQEDNNAEKSTRLQQKPRARAAAQSSSL